MITTLEPISAPALSSYEKEWEKMVWFSIGAS